jgi:hypothetical protein
VTRSQRRFKLRRMTKPVPTTNNELDIAGIAPRFATPWGQGWGRTRSTLVLEWREAERGISLFRSQFGAASGVTVAG